MEKGEGETHLKDSEFQLRSAPVQDLCQLRNLRPARLDAVQLELLLALTTARAAAAAAAALLAHQRGQVPA